MVRCFAPLSKFKAKQLEPVGRPDIGGPFQLVDDKGNVRRSTEFEGKWMLLYFGFTFCPDICPTELTKITEAITRLGSASSNMFTMQTSCQQWVLS